MSKKVIFIVSIIANILLAIFLVVLLVDAGEKLKFEYVEQETISPDVLRRDLEREYYGQAASLSHSIRGGAEIAEEYKDYFLLGEYTDLLFLKEVFAKAGNTDTLTVFERRLSQIREEMRDYSSLLDKMEQSAAKAVIE